MIYIFCITFCQEWISLTYLRQHLPPALYALLGGPILMMGFKAASTLDSMVGYMDDKYRDIGWFSARLDDVLRRHIETGADMTAVCTSIPGDVSDTYFTLDETGRITDTAYDVFAPAGYRCLNMFILSKKLLLQMSQAKKTISHLTI